MDCRRCVGGFIPCFPAFDTDGQTTRVYNEPDLSDNAEMAKILRSWDTLDDLTLFRLFYGNNCIRPCYVNRRIFGDRAP